MGGGEEDGFPGGGAPPPGLRSRCHWPV